MKLVPRGDTDRGRRLPVAGPAPLRRAGRRRAAGRAADVHAVQRRPGRGRALPGQGRDPVRARPAASSAWCARPQLAGFDRVIGFDMGGTSTDVSHYAGEFERAFETPGRRRAPARADDGHPHRRRRRRLDPALRRRPLPRRAGLGRRRPGPGLLPPRRPAHRHRRQRDARPDPAGALSPGVRARRRPAARRATSSATASPRSPPRSASRPATTARPSRSPRASCRSRWPTWPTRSSTSRCSAATTSPRYTLTSFGGAGGQHACVVADALGIRTRPRAPAGRRAVGLRHGPRRHTRHARAGRRGAAGRRRACRGVRGPPTTWTARPAPNCCAEGVPDDAHPRSPAACTCATTAPTPRSSSRSDRARRDAAALRGGLPRRFAS